jgi:two-component system cell cycle sensor histidine kinase/response regulator CckA
VIATDTEGRVTFLNPVAEALTRWTVDEARGQALSSVFRLVDAATRAECESPIARALRENHVVTLGDRIVLLAKDGSEVRIDDSAAPIRDEQHRPVGAVVVFRDVSERQHAAERLHEAEEQLRQAQKMEAIGRLAGGVAHDVNNMMAVVLGYAEMLLASLERRDDRYTMVEEIRQAADRSASMTRQLLAFSRRQVLNPTPTHLAQVVTKAGPMLSRLAGPDVTLEIECAEPSGAVFVDREQIEHVLVNLVANAREAMPGGGRIRLVVRDETLDAAHAGQTPDVRPGDYVRLSVSDTGIGMDAETAAQVFEPFYTTKDIGKGAGLGLATVYGIVRQSDGFICVDSRVGAGTTFTIHLPRIDHAAA